jgi:serine/threonine protein phosphatase PrpC
MPASQPQVATPLHLTPSMPRKPLDEEIDVFGLTHPGLVRGTNQDHFLICSLHRRIEVHGTSLPTANLTQDQNDRLAFLAMVADGVGGGAGGE